MDRRAFIQAGAAAGLAGCAKTGRGDGARKKAFAGASLAELADGLRRGRWKSVELVEYYTNRAVEIDSGGAALRSIIEHNPDAMKEAWRLDEERKAGKERGRLHGVPILIKDNIDTGDGMMTTAGSLALEGWHAPVDATLVRLLRQNGALPLGKTNLSEWANFRSARSTSGWSGRGGQTKNPHVLSRNPSGSSSGSAVAVAADLCAAAIGTETDGSIVSPASVNGIVGIKPTVGLVSRAGVIPISHSQDTAGPMTRCVMDAAIVLEAIVGEDAGDAATGEQRGKAVGHYVEAMDATALRGARLGLVRGFVPNHPAADKVLNESVRVLRDRGAEVVELKLENAGKLSEAEFTVLLYEFKAGLDAYLARMPEGKPRTLGELIEFNKRNAAAEMPWFGQETLELAAGKGPLSEAEYVEARRTCLRISRTEGIDAAMAKHALSAIVGITEGPAWPTDWVNGDHFSGGASTWAAVAGYPHVTVPAGMAGHLPVGFSFFGKAWSERVLIALAGAFEHATEARRAPGFLREA